MAVLLFPSLSTRKIRMSSLLLDDPATTDTPNVEAADRLRTTMAAVRVCFTWFGTRKTLSPE